MTHSPAHTVGRSPFLFRSVIGVVLGWTALFATACAAPDPRAPESFQQASSKPRPTWIERLELSARKADRIAEIWASADQKLAGYDRARLLLLDEAVLEVKAGRLERDTLFPLGEQTVAEFEKALPAFITALNRLHKTLNQEERKRLVNMVLRQTDTKDEKKTARQDRLAQVLDITAGQKAQLYPRWFGVLLGNLGLLKALKRDARDAGKRFVSEEFDAAQLPLIENRRPLDILEFYYDGLKTTLPVLTPAQRDTLAAYLDARVR